MNQRDAAAIIEGGITCQELRDSLRDEYDEGPSTTIKGFTKLEARLFFRGCIDGKDGAVRPKSWQALCAQLVLREFGPDQV